MEGAIRHLPAARERRNWRQRLQSAPTGSRLHGENGSTCRVAIANELFAGLPKQVRQLELQRSYQCSVTTVTSIVCLVR